MRKQNINNFVIVIGASLLLSSCFVAKDYQRPNLKETQNLYRTDNLPKDSLSMANISWKELYTDSYLVKYIEEGLQNNMDIRIAMQQMLAAEAYMKQGKAGYLPSIIANASITHQELSKNSQFGSFLTDTSTDQYDLTANLSWEADIWGKIRSTKRASQASYLQSVAAHQVVKTQLIASIAETYYHLITLDAQLKIANQTINAQEKSVETIKALKEAGQVTQVAVDQYIAQYNNSKALQIDIERAINQTENVLSILLGKEPQYIERNSLVSQTFNDDIKLGVPYLLLRNRPDVLTAEYSLINAFEYTNVARSNFYPSLKLTATGGLQSVNLDEWLNANSLFTNIIGGLTQPVFNQRKIKTQYEVAKAQQEQALLSFKKALLIAGQEVSDALYLFNSETKKYEFLQKEVEALKNAEKNSEELLNNGYATYLDLLTARQGALRSELNIVDNKLQQLTAKVKLYKALGGGWQ